MLSKALFLAAFNVEQEGQSCLHMACSTGYLDVVKHVCEQGGNVLVMIKDVVSIAYSRLYMLSVRIRYKSCSIMSWLHDTQINNEISWMSSGRDPVFTQHVVQDTWILSSICLIKGARSCWCCRILWVCAMVCLSACMWVASIYILFQVLHIYIYICICIRVWDHMYAD